MQPDVIELSMNASYDLSTSRALNDAVEMFNRSWSNDSAIFRSNRPTEPAADSSMTMIRFICEVVLSFPIAVFGILGNILAFVVLCRQKKRLTTNVLLQTLAIADTLILISSILIRSMRHINWKAYNGIYDYIFLALYPCVYFFRLADTWITVLMTVDRYIAVCYPLQAQRLCRLRRTYIIIGIILVTTFTFSMPRLFEFKLTDKSFVRQGYIHTALVRNKTYTVVYRIILFFLVMYLIPMNLLIVLNIRLLHTLRTAYRKRDSMLSSGSSHGKAECPSGATKSGRGVTLMVVTLVIVCIICNVVVMITHVFWALQACFTRLRYLERPRRLLANFNNIMVTLNSAINFLIYCMVSRKFRAGVLDVLRCCRPRCLWTRRRPVSGCSTSTGSNTSYASMAKYPERVSFKSQKAVSRQRNSTEF